MLGLYPWWGNPRLVTSCSPPSFVVFTEGLAIACLSAAASALATRPPSSSPCCPLAPYFHTPLTSWQPTAHHRLTPSCYSPAGTLLLIVVGWHPLGLVAPVALLPLGISDHSSVTPSCSIALPLELLSNALDQCNNLLDRASCYSGPMVPLFSPVDDHLRTPRARVSGLRTGGFLGFGDPAAGFRSFYHYVSMYCFLTSLGFIILGARQETLFLWTRAV